METFKLTGSTPFNKIIETIEKMDFVVRSGTPDKFIDADIEMKQWKILLCVVFPTESEINVSIMLHDKNLFLLHKKFYISTTISANDNLELCIKYSINSLVLENGKKLSEELFGMIQNHQIALEELLVMMKSATKLI